MSVKKIGKKTNDRCKATLDNGLARSAEETDLFVACPGQLWRRKRLFINGGPLDESALCLLAGLTASGTRDTLSWLSDAFSLVADRCQTLPEQKSSPQAPLLAVKIVYFCQTNYTVTKRLGSSFFDIIGSIYQHPSRMRPTLEGITDTISSDRCRNENPQVAFKVMADLLVRCMGVFSPSTRMLMVIDRLDQCRWSRIPNEANALPEVVKSLTRLVEDGRLGHLRVKMLVVMDGMSARQLPKNVTKHTKNAVYWKTHWDQEEFEDE
ncbi:hypothetical protein LTR86_005661 [Recurvomyces mirabilis]|nr:hypothetical protein LTR86_005661 [Recurvomyces mirabilis]